MAALAASVTASAPRHGLECKQGMMFSLPRLSFSNSLEVTAVFRVVGVVDVY